MFLEKGNLPGRKNRIIIGYDLSDEHSQISFCRVDGGEPETVSVVEGEEQYDFPTVLARRPDMNQWFFGREARREAESGNGILVEHLLTLALFSGGIIGSFYEEKPVASGNGQGSGRDGGVGGHSGKPGPAHGAGTGRSGFHNAVADGACLFSELWGMFLSVYASSAQRTLAGSVPCM